MPADRQTLYCPRCRRRPLERCAHKSHAMAVCSRCAGLWCSPTAWDHKRLGPLPEPLAARASDADPRSRVGLTEPGFHFPTPAPLECPECRSALTAFQCGGEQGCEIDQCSSCGGVWLDHGEWEHLEAVQTINTQKHELDRAATWGEWAFQFFLRLPVEFNVEPRHFPVATVTLIALCALTGLVQLAVGTDAWLPWALRSSDVLGGEALLPLLTNMFLHAGPLHLLTNMYFLYILGDNVEDVLGHWAFVLFYLACGLAANGVWLLINPASDLPLIGASGAVSGVMAAYFILFRQARLTFMVIFWQFKVPAWAWIGFWFGFQIFGAFLDPSATGGGLAFLAHVGGFVAGALIVWPWEEALLKRNPLLRLLRERQVGQ